MTRTMKVDTLRILITLDCTRKCEYCCNKFDSTKSKITTVTKEVLYRLIPKYDNICITGGEPFFNVKTIIDILLVAQHKNVYIYTNGDLFNRQEVLRTMCALEQFNESDSFGNVIINATAHDTAAIDHLIFYSNLFTNIRVLIPDTLKQYVEDNNYSVRENVIKYFEIKDNCNMPNEYWVQLP